jgi:uncharacterized protein YjbI with pentapeptide repeats
MARRDPGAPRIDPVVLPALDAGERDALGPGVRVDATRFTGFDASGTSLAGAVVDECLLEDLRLDDAVLDGARIVDGVLDGVTATRLRGAGLALRDVRIEGCRFGAAEWFEAELDRVELVGCRIDYLALTDARLTDVRLTDCTVGDLDLRGATARRVAFVGSRVRELSVRDARLEHLDLRGAELDGVDDARSLAGAVISADQLPRFAPLLAESIGLRVD